MPLPRDILDLILVPDDPDLPPPVAGLTALLDGFVADGRLAPARRPLRHPPGPHADQLVAGGFSTLWVDLPGQRTLYANQLGGVRVDCPDCGRPLAREFGQAAERWRAGGDDTVTCPDCGLRRAVASLPLRPPGAFARVALVFADAAGVEPAAPLLEALQPLFGHTRVVLRRRS